MAKESSANMAARWMHLKEDLELSDMFQMKVTRCYIYSLRGIHF